MKNVWKKYKKAEGSWPVARSSGQRGQNTVFMLACLMSSCAGGELWRWLFIHNKTQMGLAFCFTPAELESCLEEVDDVWERQQAAVCINMGKCVCLQWDRIMLQCLWNSIMCAMCFYELIKPTFRAKRGEMMEGGKQEGTGGAKNQKKETRRGQTEKENKRDCCVFASK